jgi:bifunctional non-homologous end joining protein LigD
VRSRRGRDWSACFPELGELARAAPRRAIVDGELVGFDEEGHPDFARLRTRLAGARGVGPATLVIFDLLHLDGRPTSRLPYRRRRELLEGLGLDGPAWRTPRAFVSQREARALFAETEARQLEGIVLKRLESPYQPGRRSGAWLKRKHTRRELLLVTGWMPASARGRLDVFLVARPAAVRPMPAGSVELGLTVEQREQLRGELVAREVAARGRVRRVRPTLAVEVEHHGRADGPVRDGVLRELRQAAEVGT